LGQKINFRKIHGFDEWLLDGLGGGIFDQPG